MKALFSNFVAIDYKIGLNDLVSSEKLKLILRKAPAHLIPNYQNGFYHVKIGLRILTTIATKTAFIKEHIQKPHGRADKLKYRCSSAKI
jgi:hypothetical protein